MKKGVQNKSIQIDMSTIKIREKFKFEASTRRIWERFHAIAIQKSNFIDVLENIKMKTNTNTRTNQSIITVSATYSHMNFSIFTCNIETSNLQRNVQRTCLPNFPLYNNLSKWICIV